MRADGQERRPPGEVRHQPADRVHRAAAGRQPHQRSGHHAESGEAMIDEFADRRRPRSFRVILDPSKMKYNDSGEERTDAEVALEILKTLGHELVHVKQYVRKELTTDRYGALRYNGVHYSPKNLLEYFDLPYEIEAYGREKGLLVGFLAVWKDIEEELL